MIRKRIPIGIEFYQEMMEKEYYYVDKTLLIKEILDKGGKVTLFTRPRRFGKTLALTMLQAFFELEPEKSGRKSDKIRYFEGMKIAEAGEKYLEHMGRYPVIFLSLKSARQPDFEMAYENMVDEIVKEYERHQRIVDGLTEPRRKRYRLLMNRRADRAAYGKALQFLSECLEQYYGRKTVLLLDEYDVPLENAYLRGFYQEMTDFVRSLFESALKTNKSLEFAVITGCLRISKESIFTGLNNLEIISVLNEEFGEYFGFTRKETEEALEYYGFPEKMEEAQNWYDGYLFGNVGVYNPWSILNYIKALLASDQAFPKSYWSNTSSNSIVKELVETADTSAKKEIETLIAGGTIEKPVQEDITYGDIQKSQDNLWNFLFFTGYLKKAGERRDARTVYLTLKIPNEEVLNIYETTIREWFEEKIKVYDFTAMYQAMLKGDCEKFGRILKQQLMESISFYDNQESFYHGFLLGLLRGLKDYEVLSNRESGEGRPDILLKPYDEQKPAVILELKYAGNFKEMEALCQKALTQIQEKKYTDSLSQEGYQTILKYGVCFYKKSCMVRKL